MDLITSGAALPTTYKPYYDARYGLKSNDRKLTTSGTKYGEIRRELQKQKLALCWTTLIWTLTRVSLRLQKRST